MAQDPAIEMCPVEYTIGIIGGKYKPLLLWQLQDGALRFSEIRKRLPQATAKMLTQHLRELERHGMIKRKVFRWCRQKWNIRSPTSGKASNR